MISFVEEDLHILFEVADIDGAGTARVDAELVFGGADRPLKTEKFGDDPFDIRFGGDVRPDLDLIGLLDILQHRVTVGMIDGHLQQAILHLEGQDQLADGKVAGDGLGGDIHVQFEGIELFKGELVLSGHGPHDHFFVDQPPFSPGQLEVEGGEISTMSG